MSMYHLTKDPFIGRMSKMLSKYSESNYKRLLKKVAIRLKVCIHLCKENHSGNQIQFKNKSKRIFSNQGLVLRYSKD